MSGLILSSGGGSSSLQAAYNVGASISTGANGTISFSDTAADNNNVLTVTKNPGGPQTGDGISATVGVNVGSSSAAIRGTSNSVGSFAGAFSNTVNNGIGLVVTTNNTTLASNNGTAEFSDTTNGAFVYVGNGFAAITPKAGTIIGTWSAVNGTSGGPINIAGGLANQASDSGGDVNLQVAVAGTGTTLTSILNIAGASGTAAFTNNLALNSSVLTVTKNPAGAQSGNAFSVTMGALTTGGAALLQNVAGATGPLLLLRQNTSSAANATSMINMQGPPNNGTPNGVNSLHYSVSDFDTTATVAGGGGGILWGANFGGGGGLDNGAAIRPSVENTTDHSCAILFFTHDTSNATQPTQNFAISGVGQINLGGLTPNGGTRGRINWNTGLGAITHILGPTDQNFTIAGGNTGGSSLSLNGGTAAGAGGGGVLVVGGSGAIGFGGGPVKISSGGGAGNDQSCGGVLISTVGATGVGTSDFNIQTGFTTASGGSAQSAGDRYYIQSHSVTMSTTTATATTITAIKLQVANAAGGCIVQYCVIATDGTNFDSAVGSFAVNAMNKAGTVTASSSAITDESNGNQNSGTLTAGTTSVAIAGNVVNIKIAPAWTVIVPTSVITLVTVTCFGQGVIVVPA